MRVTDFEYDGDRLVEAGAIVDGEIVGFQLSEVYSGKAIYATEDHFQSPDVEVRLSQVENRLEGAEEASAEVAVNALADAYSEAVDVEARDPDADIFQNDALEPLI